MAAACAEFIFGSLAENPHRVGTPLRDELAGRYSARRGEFRVIYEIHDDRVLVRVITVRHRRDAYSRRDVGRSRGGRVVTDWRADRVQSAIDGRNPTVLAELDASYAVIGDVQFLPGYSLVLTKTPGVDRLSDLSRVERLRFLADVDLVAEAVEAVCRRFDPAYRRINVEILGNTDAFLHCHIWPRYEWEPEEVVGKPVWLYPPDRWRDPSTALGPLHDELRAALTAAVVSRRDSVEFGLEG